MKKIMWLILFCLMVVALMLASCGDDEEEEITVPTEEEEVTIPTEEEEVTVPTEEEQVKWWEEWGITTGSPAGVVKWWEKDENVEPEYGGTFTYSGTGDPSRFDPYFGLTGDASGLCLENVAMPGWMNTPPEKWEFASAFYPIEYVAPSLAESWEIDNAQTITFHIRKGVYWQDRYPVNGREFTAYDVEYTWHRQFGLGSGYTEQSPYNNSRVYGPPTSVTAKDKNTVVIELPNPSLSILMNWFRHIPYINIMPREAIELWGDINECEHVIGTGPYMTEEYIAGTSLTYIKNPNYWGYDEHYPENRLPYVDKVKKLIIPDTSTAYAALRTGKIDMVYRVDWEQSQQLLKTNPELECQYHEEGGMTIALPLDRLPYSDKRVRQAMQMSIDLETIAETYFGGVVSGRPIGQVQYRGWRAEYEDWPQEVKDSYAYNPEGAKALLAEAGYPDGFQCTITASSTSDLDLLQIVQAYLAEIGIDMEVEVFEPTTFNSYVKAGKAEIAYGGVFSAWGGAFPPDRFNQLTSTHKDALVTHINDPVIDEMYANMQVCLDWEELRQMVIDADMYVISQQYEIYGLPDFYYRLIQPWVMRYTPVLENNSAICPKYARFWIDQNMKKVALGY